MREYMDIHPDVRTALDLGNPVVALESTIIAHGMPHPQNLETARRVEEVIEQAGAVPATIGIIQGRIKVGLTWEETEYLAKAKDVVKVSRRDFPLVLAEKRDGATTVAGTMLVAEQAGIRIFVTGGIGGVHRGAGKTFDISADLEELKNTDVVVVCAGVKSILDIGGTLEYLETAGVPVFGFQTHEFPAFYSRQSGFPAEYTFRDADHAASVIQTKYGMGLKGGMVIACPIPEEWEIPCSEMDEYIQSALEDCQSGGIAGKRVTPFLLGRIKELTSGKSLEANIRLVLNNALIGAQIAGAYRRKK
jgi:pseudouridine-5'-phosphate glycosidase